MDISVKCYNVDNVNMMIEALLNEGYSVKIEPVNIPHKLFDNRGSSYYIVTFSNDTPNDAYEN